MPGTQQLIVGKFRRKIDERYRLSVPKELTDMLMADRGQCILAKERPGCVSLWNAELWKAKLDEGVALIEQKIRSGRFEGRVGQFQLLGRLLSTRHEAVRLDGHGRLLIRDAFREFLHVEPGSQLMVVGAAVCVEIWNPAAWVEYVEGRIPKFRRLFERLSR